MSFILALAVACCGAISVKAAEGDGRKLVHVVAFKFKEGVKPEQIAKLEESFRALKAKIPEIVSYAGGADVSDQKRSKGFRHCSVLTFKSQKDLDAYIAHPDHQALKNSLGEIVADIFVVDFWE